MEIPIPANCGALVKIPVKIRPFRYGNGFERGDGVAQIELQLKSDRFGMEISFLSIQPYFL